MHTDRHTCRHTSRHTWEKCVISTLLARQQPALGSNLRSRSREEMLTGLKRVLSLSASVCREEMSTVGQDTRTNSSTMSQSVCLGLRLSRSVSLCLFRSVCLGVSVSNPSVEQDTRPNTPTMSIMQCPPGRACIGDLDNAVSPRPAQTASPTFGTVFVHLSKPL